jgi:hypothetical protein
MMPLMGDETSPSVPEGGEVPVSAAVQARQRGLWLVARVNRWMIGLAVILAGALTGLTAHAFHPKTASAQTTTPAPSQTSNAGGAGPAPLQSPSSAPAPAVPTPVPVPVGPVVSGGS